MAPFNQRQLMDKLWGQLIAIGRELSIEQRECAKRKGMTTRYANVPVEQKHKALVSVLGG